MFSLLLPVLLLRLFKRVDKATEHKLFWKHKFQSDLIETDRFSLAFVEMNEM